MEPNGYEDNLLIQNKKKGEKAVLDLTTEEMNKIL